MAEAVGFDELLTFLQASPFFATLDTAEVVALLEIVQVKDYPAGHTIFAQGDKADAWYVVYRGTAEVRRKPVTGPGKVLGAVEASGCFGEMAILEEQPRFAAVAARDAVVVLRFPRTKFQRMLDDRHPAALKLVSSMARTLSHRQRELHERLEHLEAQVLALATACGLGADAAW